MMNNPTTNLGIIVANSDVANFVRMNNPSPSEARINNLIPNLVSVSRNNLKSVHTPDHMEHPFPEDRALFGEPCPSNW